MQCVYEHMNNDLTHMNMIFNPYLIDSLFYDIIYGVNIKSDFD